MTSEKLQRLGASRRRHRPIVIACHMTVAMCGATAAQAQQATQSLETVVVTGIRKSLETTTNLKRTATGLVDGIVAEDIGKFPDTNLAESMQRIAGVSIDRNASGEGSRVTVRGVGPEFNMVLLNGRQMPTSAGGTRAFDFANLSSDAVSALEVYKTARASSPTGGIGATINVKTARPLDQRETLASVGVKMNYDESIGRLPSEIAGSKTTPEVSGIYSTALANNTIGIAISGNYSKRNSGSNNAFTGNGWETTAWNKPGSAWAKSSPDGSWIGPIDGLKNYPTSGYVTHTNDVRYRVTDLERERINGQAVLQFAPSKDLKFTLDHTLAINTTKSKAIENSAWFGPSFSGALGSSPPSTFVTTGQVSDPIIQTATWDGTHDYAMYAAQFANKTKLNSTGLNAAWKVSEALNIDFDAHSSKSRTRPDSPYGSGNIIDLALFNQGNTTMYYDQKFPVMESKTLAYNSGKTTVTGSQFENNIADQDVDQVQLSGTYRLNAADKLLAGLGFTKLKNRSAGSNNFHGDWGGIGPQGSFKDVPVAQYSLPGFFNRIPGHDDPRQFQTFFVPDFNALRAQAVKNAQSYRPTSLGDGAPLSAAEAEAYFSPYTDFSHGNDWRTTEKSTSIYGQWDHAFDTEMPMNVSVGLRYERTKVDSTSQVTSYTGTVWYAENEVKLTGDTTTFGTKTGKYSYVLPSIDWDMDVTDKLKVRASYGVNIGRPAFSNMLGGIQLNANSGRYNINGSGSTGDPALKPLKSKNLDLSAEYYYTKSSYVAAGLFYKKVTDFFSTKVVQATFAGLNQPASGTYYDAARASGIPADSPKLLRNYILKNYNGQPGVKITDASDPTFLKGDILGSVPGTKPLVFDISTPSNGDGDNIKGVELNFSHVFGTTGFGVSGNYTYVKSGLEFNNNAATTDVQTGLVGISNSANLVGFFENDQWSVRAAYNWRGGFLAARDDNGNNPRYTEAYGQVDASIGYKIGKNLTLQADLLNLNDGYIRQHGRSKNEIISAIQTGRRYLVGARYRF
ncbi:TonB-dependent receptor [Pelomonas cellulosilytica]|uniref:TonB-dependent receptor n=1 Tax=Pelomonas cellulosilytica TaxID=2906762 RepID=A0ABS8XZC7_9BURK|nr:TonB-dependent receptor [Pelomonas sp. P8]MCE4557333.1 TonB-dependent receptor [Pelomonas sp. P8]